MLAGDIWKLHFGLLGVYMSCVYWLGSVLICMWIFKGDHIFYSIRAELTAFILRACIRCVSALCI